MFIVVIKAEEREIRLGGILMVLIKVSDLALHDLINSFKPEAQAASPPAPKGPLLDLVWDGSTGQLMPPISMFANKFRRFSPACP